MIFTCVGYEAIKFTGLGNNKNPQIIIAWSTSIHTCMQNLVNKEMLIGYGTNRFFEQSSFCKCIYIGVMELHPHGLHCAV